MCLYSAFVISTKCTFWPSKPTHPQNRQPSAFIVATRHSSKTQHGWIHLLALHAMFALCRRLTGNWDKSSIFAKTPTFGQTVWKNPTFFGGLSWLKFLNFKVRIMDPKRGFFFDPFFKSFAPPCSFRPWPLPSPSPDMPPQNVAHSLLPWPSMPGRQGHRTENRAKLLTFFFTCKKLFKVYSDLFISKSSLFKFWETNSHPIFQGMSRLQIIRHLWGAIYRQYKVDHWLLLCEGKETSKTWPPEKRTKRFSLAHVRRPDLRSSIGDMKFKIAINPTTERPQEWCHVLSRAPVQAIKV